MSDDGDIPPAEVAAPSDVVQRDVDGVFVASSAASDVAADTVMVPENSVSSEPAEPTWWGEPPSEVPAEDPAPPLVVPEQPEPYRGSSGPIAGDVFDSARVSDPQRPLRAGLIASAPPVKVPQLSPTPETIEKVSVSELARQAKEARAEVQTTRRAEARPRRRGAPRPPPDRRYPEMIALLEEPEQFAYLTGPIEEPAPPVPGTFFRAAPEPRRRTELDADMLLSAMAESLLVGGDGAGGSEVLVTLRDDFFMGTELWISFRSGDIQARLVPPDWDTYRVLTAELHRLEGRLGERGLRVSSLSVDEP